MGDSILYDVLQQCGTWSSSAVKLFPCLQYIFWRIMYMHGFTTTAIQLHNRNFFLHIILPQLLETDIVPAKVKVLYAADILSITDSSWRFVICGAVCKQRALHDCQYHSKTINSPLGITLSSMFRCREKNFFENNTAAQPWSAAGVSGPSPATCTGFFLQYHW